MVFIVALEKRNTIVGFKRAIPYQQNKKKCRDIFAAANYHNTWEKDIEEFLFRSVMCI